MIRMKFHWLADNFVSDWKQANSSCHKTIQTKNVVYMIQVHLFNKTPGRVGGMALVMAGLLYFTSFNFLLKKKKTEKKAKTD